MQQCTASVGGYCSSKRLARRQAMPPSPPLPWHTWLQAAATAHAAGQLDAAEQGYRQVLAAEPNLPPVWHLLGSISLQRDHPQLAVEPLQRSLALDDSQADCQTHLGEALRRLKRWPEAEHHLRRSVTLQPHSSAAYNSLALLEHDRSQFAEALQWSNRAVECDPRDAQAQHNRGWILESLGRTDEAVSAYHAAINLKRDYLDPYCNLGALYYRQHDDRAALEWFNRALELQPNHAVAHNNRGLVLQRLGRRDEARAAFEQARQLAPQYDDAYTNLASLLFAQGDLSAALECAQRAVELQPLSATAHRNHGVILERLGRVDQALNEFRQAIELDPRDGEALASLGQIEHVRGHYGAALPLLRRATECAPQSARVWTNLGMLLRDVGHFGEAWACYERSRQIDPRLAPTWNNLGSLCMALGRVDEACPYFERASELDADYLAPQSNRLLAELYRPQSDVPEQARLHLEWGERFAQRHPQRTLAPRATRRPGEPLRVGFVSADLLNHPVGHLLLPLLKHLDRAEFHTVLYSNGSERDAISERLRGLAGAWHDVAQLDDDALAALIAADGIDVLFDLHGHVGAGRAALFARRAAAVQVNWLGYSFTTGLSAIDYLLTDRITWPVEFRGLCAERVVELPDYMGCYAPPDELPPLAPPPCLARGSATFGSFNNPAKLNDEVLALWGEILARCPNARLILKYTGLDDPAAAAWFQSRFRAVGIDPARVELRGTSPFVEMLRQYADVDVALDPYPFGGGHTTFLALVMGVSVVSWPQPWPAGRQTAAMLDVAGLSTLIAHDRDEYIEQAVRLASDPGMLQQLRASLRERVLRSPLCDAARFAENWGRVVRALTPATKNR